MRYEFSEDAGIRLNLEKSSSKDNREYDFDEHRDLLLSSTILPGDIFSDTVTVIFRNNITDDSLRIVTGLIDLVIPPEMNINVVFDTGYHEIVVIPLHKYKQQLLRRNLIF